MKSSIAIFISIKLISIILISQIDNHNHHNGFVDAFKFTDRFCNYTAYPTNGCEESEFTTCIDNKCACRDESDYIIMGRFCTKKLCSNGEFFDAVKQKCSEQSKASTDFTENHCRYDYHCFGQHIRCRRQAWNYICFCEPGFQYDSYSKLCLPKHGIGGHCKHNNDCDDTTLRKMFCDFNQKQNDNDNDDNDRKSSSGTCQCQENHRYNYIIDGCEALADINEREHNMRTLVLLFVAAGLLFGLALTCNFSFFGLGTKNQEIFLQQLKAEERIRQMKRDRDRLSRAENGQMSNENATTTTIQPEPKIISLNGKDNNDNDDNQQQQPSTLNVVDNSTIIQQQQNESTNKSSVPSRKSLIMLE
ncbi:uncharacterized protein LOC113796931 [Dermatophagoides pteronyssinus]|uniref:uncharacterized protein LOC113796931 n=1 Tax=Dermatophagoides pteronyssinus TaxID=6956 RepID=UPI003F66E8F0